MTALLLDDNLLSSARVESQLRAAGYTVLTRTKLPENQDLDLILINLGSRRLNGLDLIGSCKTQYPSTPVWGFCGHLETEIRQSARAASIDKLLTNDNAMSALADILNPATS